MPDNAVIATKLNEVIKRVNELSKEVAKLQLSDSVRAPAKRLR